MTKRRILSGMRPTGKLHLGHYFGALKNWVALQDEYRCFFMVADWHALTTDYADTSHVRENTREMVIDWLTVGIDPEKSVIFRQSDVREHAELFLLLSMITPLGWLFRCPTYKEQLKEIKNKDLHNIGFLGYPVLQAADILIYKADAVPVGEDQLPHLELTREICRRFANFYGDVFPEPQAILTKAARVPGLDTRKMSKSYGNAITLAEGPDEIRRKVQLMFTDPSRMRASDPGHPEGCVVFAFHELYNTGASGRKEECKAGGVGCVACKKQLVELMTAAIAPMAEKRRAISADAGSVDRILEEGARKACETAARTMEDVRRAIRL